MLAFINKAVSDMNQGRKQQVTKPKTGHIRLISGKHRGRKLPVLMAEGLRPTTDRVKETVFNWLMPYISQSHCLDCFTGAGSLGFEAVSRGAKQVTLIELNNVAVKQLQTNKARLKAGNVDIFQCDTVNYLQEKPKQTYDIVFVDPPFRKNLVTKTAQLLSQGWLAEQALVYVEMEAEAVTILPNNWQLVKEKVAGQVAYRLYQIQ
jgi:16S rRNA (guanine966-N2)-methyltransferase